MINDVVLPTLGKQFRAKGDMSYLMLDEYNHLAVYQRSELAWSIDFPEAVEKRAWQQIKCGDWTYLFEHTQDNIEADSLDAALDHLLRESIENQYAKYLQENRLPSNMLSVTGVLRIKTKEDYCSKTCKLENNSYYKVEVWRNQDKTISGMAFETERDKIV